MSDPPATEFRQCDESLPARVVLVHYPGTPNWMGAMHPNGALYETGVDLSAARAEHEGFRKKLESHGCKVHAVYDVLLDKCEENVNERVRLEDLAAECLTYKLVPTPGSTPAYPSRSASSKSHPYAIDTSDSDRSDGESDEGGKKGGDKGDGDGENDDDYDDEEEEEESDEDESSVSYFLSDAYKRSALEKMGNEQLCDIILTNPTVSLAPAQKNTSVLAVSYSFDPLVNLIFTRDQSITTNVGVVLTRPQTEMRLREIKVIRFCLQKLGVPIIAEVPAPGTLEGGDFFPAGEDLCIIGVGLRSNMSAVRHLMRGGHFGTRRVAVAKDYFDQSQERMHLDTYSSIVGPYCMTVLEDILGADSPQRRLVDEYVRGPDGKYRLNLQRHDVEFGAYMEAESYRFIHITNEQQLDYGINGLSVGNGVYLSPHLPTAKILARHPGFNLRVEHVPFREMMNCFGSLHCCSQVISRDHSAMRHGKVTGAEGEHASASTSADVDANDVAVRPLHTRAIMIIPFNFRREKGKEPAGVTEDSTASPANIAAHAARLPSATQSGVNPVEPGSTSREMRRQMLCEHERLHALLTAKLGAEVFTWTHEMHHGTPEAVFVADWFSTVATATGTACVIHGAEGKRRQREISRRSIIDLLARLYPGDKSLVDISRGPGKDVIGAKNVVKAIFPKDTPPVPVMVAKGGASSAGSGAGANMRDKHKRQASVMDIPDQARPGNYLEGLDVVVDPVSSAAYLAVRTAAAEGTARDWHMAAVANGFEGEFVPTRITKQVSQGLASLGQRGHPALFLGTHAAVLVNGVMDPDCPMTAKCAEGVRQSSKSAGRLLIELPSTGSVIASGLVQVTSRDGLEHVVASKSAAAGLGDNWDAIKEAYGGRAHVVDIATIEKVSGRGLRSLIGMLR